MIPPSTPKWSRRPPVSEPPPARHRLYLLLLLCVVVAGYALLTYTYQASRRSLLPTPAAVQPAPQPLRYVTLFFANAEGTGLTGEIRQRPPCASLAACVNDVIRTLLDGPGPGLTLLFPLPTELNKVAVQGDTATVDFSRDMVNRLPGGAMSELFCLTSLADTLAVNFPQIRQLNILVDGVPVPTLKGHVDLRQPFAANFAWVRTTARTQTPSLETTTNGREE